MSKLNKSTKKKSKRNFKIEVLKGPDEDGEVITSFGLWELTWKMVLNEKTMKNELTEISRFQHKERAYEPMFLLNDEYGAHKQTALAVFYGREAIKKIKAQKELMQPRLPI